MLEFHVTESRIQRFVAGDQIKLRVSAAKGLGMQVINAGIVFLQGFTTEEATARLQKQQPLQSSHPLRRLI